MVPNPQLFCSLAGIKGEQETMSMLNFEIISETVI